jgi:glutathione S-transferase
VVPTLIHDDFVLIESSVIMQYLDEIFPQPPLQPADPKDRALMRIWMKRVDEYLHPGNATLTYAMVHAREMRSKTPQELAAYYRGIPNPATRERQRAAIEQGMDAPAAMQALQFYDKALADMDRQLAQRPWLGGEAYSLADAAMTPYINRFTMLHLSDMWTQSRPNVTAWFERIKVRPNYAAAITAFVTEADLKPYAGLQDWAWSKVQSLLKAA